MCSFFSEGDLYDLHHFGDILSWRGQHRDHLFRCRLDRDVTNRFQYLAYEGSDHKPIISFLEPGKKKRRGIFIYDSGLRAPENQIFGETNLEEHHQFVYQLLGKIMQQENPPALEKDNGLRVPSQEILAQIPASIPASG